MWEGACPLCRAEVFMFSREISAQKKAGSCELFEVNICFRPEADESLLVTLLPLAKSLPCPPLGLGVSWS